MWLFSLWSAVLRQARLLYSLKVLEDLSAFLLKGQRQNVTSPAVLVHKDTYTHKFSLLYPLTGRSCLGQAVWRQKIPDYFGLLRCLSMHEISTRSILKSVTKQDGQESMIWRCQASILGVGVDQSNLISNSEEIVMFFRQLFEVHLQHVLQIR